MSYDPPIIHRPETKEYDAGYESTFGRRCRQCKCDMSNSRKDDVWCQKCKGEPERESLLADFEAALQSIDNR